MPRGQPAESASTDDARERILAAAERCIERHGIRKTTMDDVASEVGLSRHLIEPDGTNLGRRMIASGTSETIRAALWDPFLDTALANDELPPELSRPDVHFWLGNLGRMVIRGLEDGDGDLKRYRSVLRRFVAPAFAGSTVP
jgi:Bacterial regulatory proteins, tetR family